MKTLLWSAVAVLVLAVPASAADDVQEFLFFGEKKPVLIRLHVRSDGQPVQAAWDEFQKYLFGTLDLDKDGSLSKSEAERVPSVAQILAGGIVQGGLPGGGNRATAPTMDNLDADKDGKVTKDELAAFYRKNGFAPVQFQLESPQNPLGVAAAFLGGPRPEPSVSAVSEAAFALIDADKDGKVTKDELLATASALVRRDENEDEIVTGAEMVPEEKGGQTYDLGMMMGGGNRPSSAGGNKFVVPIAKPGEVPANLLKLFNERYGQKGEAKLSRKELSVDDATFKQLDANTDGSLDADELAALVKRTPDVVLTMRLGKKDAGQTTVEVEPSAKQDSSLKVRTKEGLALLDMGVTRVDLRTDEPAAPEDRYGNFIQDQVVAQLKQADKNSDGVIDEEEAKSTRQAQLRGLYKMMDLDGNGKVTEKEMTAFLEQARELQKRSETACVTLVLTDQSRGLFDLLDTNRDARLGLREMRLAPDLLQELDQAGKGYLTKDDVPRTYSVALRRGPSDAALANPAALVALYFGGGQYESEAVRTAGPTWFRRMDRNRDGDVSRKEFLFGDETFRRLDTDGDSLISVEEADKAGSQQK